MAQAGKYLRTVTGGFACYCPSCKELHIHPTAPPYKTNWSFNGDLEKPTFSPSFRHAINKEGAECHYIVTDGQMYFCDDHTDPEFKGKTVPLPEIPQQYADFGE